MARLSPQNVDLAREIIARYPRSRSALIPLLHVAQEQDGWVTDEAMEHIAELLDLTPAEVLSTASFYEMFKREPVGQYGWDGGLGTTWRCDPTEQMVTILLTQRAWTSPALPAVHRDVLTLAYQAIDD